MSREVGRFPTGWACPTCWRRRKRWTSRVAGAPRGHTRRAASSSLGVRAILGHTPHHLSYVVIEGGLPLSVCTGGSMLFGSAGRTDLSGESQTVPLARRQYRTLHRLARLPDEVAVLPTHGFGSFCAVASSAAVDASTIAEQRAANLAFRPGGEDAFVAALIRRADRVSELLPPIWPP